MGDSISLLLMALLSLQSGPAHADSEAQAAKKANTACAVTTPAAQRADRDRACKQTAERRARVRMTMQPARNADREAHASVAAIR